MCYPCLRTPVTYVSGLYKGERGGFEFRTRDQGAGTSEEKKGVGIREEKGRKPRVNMVDIMG
jgi:hypothetical protein